MKNYIDTLLKLPFPVKWFLITEGLFGLGFGVWNVNLNFHMQSMGMSDASIGILLAINTFVTAGISVFTGDLSDRVGFYHSMIYGCIIKGIGMLIVAFSSSFSTFAIALALMAIGDALVLSCEFPFLFSFTPEEHKQTIYSLLIAFFMLSMMIGNAVGGFLAELRILPKEPYMFPIIISGLIFIVLGWGRRILPRKEIERREKARFFYHLIKERNIQWFLVYSVVAGFILNLVLSMINIILKKKFGLGDSVIGLTFSAVTFVGFLSGFLAPMLIRRFGNERTVVFALFGYSLFLGLMGISGLALFVCFWVGYTFSRLIVPPAVESRILNSIPPEEQGSFSGLRIFASNIGCGIGSYLAGVLVSRDRITDLFLIASAFVLVQLGIYWFGCRRYLKEDQYRSADA